MVEHAQQEAAKQQMTMWVVSGIAKREITLEPVQVEGREIDEKSVKWELGNKRAGIAWSVLRTPASSCTPVSEESQPEMNHQIRDMEHYVQWRHDCAKVRISWLNTRSTKSWPTATTEDELTLLVPRQVSWHLTTPRHLARWSKGQKQAV
jgi:hypothetical protein